MPKGVTPKQISFLSLGPFKGSSQFRGVHSDVCNGILCTCFVLWVIVTSFYYYEIVVDECLSDLDILCIYIYPGPRNCSNHSAVDVAFLISIV